MEVKVPIVIDDADLCRLLRAVGQFVDAAGPDIPEWGQPSAMTVSGNDVQAIATAFLKLPSGLRAAL